MAAAAESTGTLTQLLFDAQHPDVNVRRAAEQQLTAAEQKDFVQFVQALSQELVNETKDETVRQLAGLLLKNAISGQEGRQDSLKRQKWVKIQGLPAATEIKAGLLKCMESPCVPARNSACQVIAKIARLELSSDTWPEVFGGIEQLLAKSGGPEVAELRVGGNMLLGYICEDVQALSDDLGKDVIDDPIRVRILKLLSPGLVDAEPKVRLASLKAWYHGILFAEQFMQIESDRNKIFSLIGDCLVGKSEGFGGAVTPRDEVELAAWEVILQMVNEFYSVLGAYIPKLKDLSLRRIQTGPLQTAFAAVEFWSSLCDEELAVEEAKSAAVPAGAEAGGVRVLGGEGGRGYVRQYKAEVLPVLLHALVANAGAGPADEGDIDQDEWTLAMASGTSLTLCAQLLRDEVLPESLAFIEKHFGDADWQARDAAVLAYGSILEGPSTEAFAPILQKSFESLCKGLTDSSRGVRDTTAWTIGRCAKFHLQAISQVLGAAPDRPGLISLLMSKLNDYPRVAANVCWALYEICQGIKIAEAEAATSADPGYTTRTSRIDPFFTQIAEGLVEVAKRPDAGSESLRQAAHHALYMLVITAGDGEVPLKAMAILVEQLCEWMQVTLAQPFTHEIGDIQGPMCGCLNALVGRIGPGIMPSADRLYQILHATIAAQIPLVEQGAEWHSAAEEAIMAISALISSIQRQFVRYLPIYSEIVLVCLKSRQDADLCGVAIESVADIIRSLEDDTAPYIPAFVEQLFAALKDPSTPIQIKPKAMTALSDLAMTSPNLFKSYLKEFFEFLRQASAARVTEGPDSDEWISYILELRDSTLLAYISTVCCVQELVRQAAARPNEQPAAGQPTPATILEAEVLVMLDLIYLVANEAASSVSNVKNAVMLTQDLVTFFKWGLVSHMQGLPLYGFLRERCNRMDDNDVNYQAMILEELMTKFTE